MADVFTRTERSEVMRRIKGKNTKPEIHVRKFLFSEGFRFRIHQKTLIGKPDVVLKKYNAIVFVNGCFWHGHANCKHFKLPKQNAKYWKVKIENNIIKDKMQRRQLKIDGWRVTTIWECRLSPTKQRSTLKNLHAFILHEA